VRYEIGNFIIKSDIFRGFFICKNILKKLWYHDNYLKYFMFGIYNGFVSKAKVFLVLGSLHPHLACIELISGYFFTCNGLG
jgi:homogentisate 1,2-dioxygenase